MIRINPRKLLLSKWTAMHPHNREKHFLVVRIVVPEDPQQPIVDVELEAVLTCRVQLIPWKRLTDSSIWRQGWH